MSDDNNKSNRTIHYTWLVSDTEAFFKKPGPTSPRDTNLPIGLTYQEWRELFFVVLNADPDQLAGSNASGRPIMEFEEDIPGLPLLSRIDGVYRDAVFEANEVDLLEQEVKSLLSEVTNPLARSGLEKLLTITSRAKELGLSIFFMSD
jgi:hypothetical protein